MHRMIGDAGEDISEPSLRVDVVELTSLNQCISGSCTMPSGVRAREGPISPAHSHASDCSLGEHIWLVSFMDCDLGYFDHETCRLEPIENPFGPKVLRPLEASAPALILSKAPLRTACSGDGVARR